MTDRIRSRHGNVIAADFRPRGHLDLKVDCASETLYCDAAVILVRTTAGVGGKPLVVIHTLGDLTTGQVIQLTNEG